MSSTTTSPEHRRRFAVGLARAFAGAVIFGLPILMTMEMWWLGFYMESWRLALLLVLFFPFLVALSWHAGFEPTFSLRDDVVDDAGFEPTFSLRDDVVDALVAYGVGFVSSALVLWLIGVLRTDASLREMVGQVSVQAVPASIGALLSQSQLGGHDQPQRQPRGGVSLYWSQLFLMAVGALFLAFNLAPTDEMVQIAAGLSEGRTALLIVVSVAAMHLFVYAVSFRGQPADHQKASGWSVLMRFTVTGYVLAALVSAYMLWSFGRLDGLSPAAALHAVAVLGFPAAIGAAAARLIL
jgi:putative integral membrane protein (TIGR02587 family)